MVERVVNLMGGEVYFYLNNKDTSISFEILDFMINETFRLVKIFNFFDEESLLSKLNKYGFVDYNFELDFLLNEAKKLYIQTGGLFNVFLGNDILTRKLNLKKDSGNNIGDEIFDSININNLIYILDSKIVFENKFNETNLKIDLGGIAKGYIIDRVLEKTREKYGRYILDILIDARGDIVCYGKNKKLIEVENPFDMNNSFDEIYLKTGSIITSGHNKQMFDDGSHIVGNCSDILTITLKSDVEKCYLLDALGTYLIQLNSEIVLEKIEFDLKYKNIECLLVLKNGKVLRSSFWS